MGHRENDWKGKGVCPFCKKENDFRKPTFMENLRDVGAYAAKWCVGSKAAKVKNTLELAEDLLKDGEGFPNFICKSCGGKVHQCSACKEIQPYQDHGKCSKCGYG